ncbi:MAG: hydrogenase nickel incorporation protein HypB [Acidisphaera sp.]|nr:hydrogenase nickel incorporation protein HypB [Acidisphaera sp.]
MCTTCGCSAGEVVYSEPATGMQIVVPGPEPENAGHRHAHDHAHDHGHHHHDHDHHHGHHHHHEHDHDHRHARTVSLEQDILAKNRLAAERNRGWFAGREVLAINLMSSPGAGKTTLLERTIRDLAPLPICVIEGDQATANDGARIRAAGAPVIQINTGTGCHLDAEMVARGVQHLAPERGAVVMIENVGNLVCPALFDLGEDTSVVILSVTEGDDKPQKYPHMFRACQVMVINKTDLLPYVRFDMDRCIAAAREANPEIRIFQLSAETGGGLDSWYDWLRKAAPGSGQPSYGERR